MTYTRETADTSWASPGAEGVIVQLARAASESPRILHRVTIVRIGKRDLVATDVRGVEHRFRVTEVDEYGFRTAANRSAWSPTEVLVDPASSIVHGAKVATKASNAYTTVQNIVDELRHDRTVEVAEKLSAAASALASALAAVEDFKSKETL